MGSMGMAGWAQYWVQAGYDTYVIDRPGHGRAIYHPEALGEIVPVFNFASITADFKRAAVEPNRRWMGTGDVGDPAIDQFQAGQTPLPETTRSRRGIGHEEPENYSTSSVPRLSWSIPLVVRGVTSRRTNVPEK